MIIFILTLVFMVTVIPYAFHVVIQQLKDQFGEEEKGNLYKSSKIKGLDISLYQIVMMSNDQAHSTWTISPFHSKGSDLFASEGHNTVDILAAQPGKLLPKELIYINVSTR